MQSENIRIVIVKLANIPTVAVQPACIRTVTVKSNINPLAIQLLSCHILKRMPISKNKQIHQTIHHAAGKHQNSCQLASTNQTSRTNTRTVDV